MSMARMIGITEVAGARLINARPDVAYVEGIKNWSPIWPRRHIRILPGPSSMWFDATGTRLPSPLFSGLRHPRPAAIHRLHRL
jgi:predicted oxidoreductase